MRKLLLLSVVAFGLSGYFLYSVGVFDSVSNEENIENLQEINDDMIQTEIVSQQSGSTNEIVENFSGQSISIVIPKYFENEWLEIVKSELEDIWLDVEYNFVINNSDYFDKLENGSFVNDDIFLLPLDMVNEINVAKLDMENQLPSYFDSNSLWENIDMNNLLNYFVPFVVDPVALVVNKEANIIDTSVNNLVAYNLVWNQDKALSFPILIPDHISDNEILAQWDESFENQIFLKNVYENEISNSENQNYIDNMEDLANEEWDDFYSKSRLDTLVNSIYNERSTCRWFPWICLLAYEFTDMKVGFWSDVEVLNMYFKNTEWENNMYIAEIPNYDWTYPVRLWGFVVNENSVNSGASMRFLQEYIKQWNFVNSEFLGWVLLKNFVQNNFIENAGILEVIE